MAAVSVGSWLVMALGTSADAESVFFGMAGPLIAVSGTWMLIERVMRTNPAGLTALLMTGFVAKMAFFALYVVIVLRVRDVEWTAFALSFTAYFIALYAVEALLLRRLIARLT
jgi:hypothetical protein